jgi:hypothetical protein
VSRTDFDGTALVTSGSVATHAVATYDVRVRGGRLRLSLHASTGTVLDVPLDRVDARALGRAGSAIVDVDGAPLLLDLTGQASAVPTARRVGAALRGRWRRRRFMSALRGPGR